MAPGNRLLSLSWRCRRLRRNGNCRLSVIAIASHVRVSISCCDRSWVCDHRLRGAAPTDCLCGDAGSKEVTQAASLCYGLWRVELRVHLLCRLGIATIFLGGLAGVRPACGGWVFKLGIDAGPYRKILAGRVVCREGCLFCCGAGLSAQDIFGRNGSLQSRAYRIPAPSDGVFSRSGIGVGLRRMSG